MPLFMDEHRGLGGVAAADLAAAHGRDLEVQGRFGVAFRGFWFDERSGTAFCLAEATTREAVEAVHRAAHGMVPDRVVQVEVSDPTRSRRRPVDRPRRERR